MTRFSLTADMLRCCDAGLPLRAHDEIISCVCQGKVRTARNLMLFWFGLRTRS